MANKIYKNAEKGGSTVIVVAISTGIVKAAVMLGMPETFEPYAVTALSGGIMAVVNWFKHRKDK